jgi:peptidoglycan/LPS O-acetylase OafA/YrhL
VSVGTSTELVSRATVYRPDIDGLRALAILSVVLYHAGVPGITGGFTGVDIFFVISGYLIGGHIYAELRSGTFSFLRFYQRRAKRILPALFAVLAFILLATLILLSPMEAAQTARSAFAATLSASNILFWITANYFSPKTEMNPLLMTWSLGVEEQFYAVIPLLMVVLVRIRRGWLRPAILGACVISFVFAWSQLGRSPMLAFYMLPARAWELGIGVALAVAELDRMKPRRQMTANWMSAAGLALMLVPDFALTAAMPFPGPAALPSVLGTALVIAAPAGWINRSLLSWRPIIFIGKISYSWYLWHWPLLALMRIVYGGNPPATALIGTAIASLPVAALCYCFIEQPFRHSKRMAAPLLLRYAALSCVALAMCSAIWLTHGVSQRYPSLASLEFAERPLQSDPCLVGDKDSPNLSPGCYDLSTVRPSIAIWGDSHAAALASGLRAAASAQGYGVAELAKNSCPPLMGATHFLPLEPLRAAACTRFNRTVIALLQSDRNIGIVILAASWAAPLNRNWMDGWLTPDAAPRSSVPSLADSSRLFTESLTATIRALQRAGKQVIVVQDTPHFPFDPMFRVRTAQIPARRVLAHWLGAPDAADLGFAAPVAEPSIPLSISLIEQVTANLPGVALFDPQPALCASATRCAYRYGDGLLYIDSSHLSPAGAKRAIKALRFSAPGAAHK